VQLKCTCSKRQGENKTRNEYEPKRQKMARKWKPLKQKKNIKDVILEQPFGNIKHNVEYTEFLIRGLSKIAVEKDLLNSLHNLKRIWNKMLKTTTLITGIF